MHGMNNSVASMTSRFDQDKYRITEINDSVGAVGPQSFPKNDKAPCKLDPTLLDNSKNLKNRIIEKKEKLKADSKYTKSFIY